MELNNPITITPPPITKKDGSVKTFSPIAFDEFNVTIIDYECKKKVLALIAMCPTPLTLWSGQAYEAVGDYTQAQVESRILDLLGNDPESALIGLFHTNGR